MKSSEYHQRYRSRLSTGKLFAVAGAVFACALAVSATSTYAWYTISEKFRIVGFEMQISHDPEVFKLGKKEANGEISYQGSEPYSLRDLGVINPVVGNVSNMNVESYPKEYSDTFLPTFSTGYYIGGETGLTDDAANPALEPDKAEYVQFELYALTEKDAFLYLSPGTGGYANEEANSAKAREKGCDISELNNVINAARMSFYTPNGYSIAELGEHEEVTYSGLLNISDIDDYFDSEDGKEIVYGNYSGTPVFEDEPLEADEDPFEKHDIFHAKHQKGVRKWNPDVDYGAKKEVAYPLSHYIYDIEAPMFPYAKPAPIAVMQANVPTRIVVSVFLEGWDHDMTSLLIDASFGMNLGFVAEFDPAASAYFSR